LIIAFAFSLPLLNLFDFPTVGHKVQFPELIFLPLFAIAIWERGMAWLNGRHWFSWVLFAFVLANVTSAIHAGSFSALLEALGRAYLAFLSLLLADYFRRGKPGGGEKLHQVLSAWRAGVIFACILATVAYFLAITGLSSVWVSHYDVFPYFGSTFRMSGPTGHPAMLVLVAAVPVVWTYYRWRTGAESGHLLLLFLPVLVLTFSKEILLVIGAMTIIDPLLRRQRWLRWLMVGGTAVLFLGVTHFLFLAEDEPLAERLNSSVFTSGQIVWQGGWSADS